MESFPRTSRFLSSNADDLSSCCSDHYLDDSPLIFGKRGRSEPLLTLQSWPVLAPLSLSTTDN